MLGFHDGLLKQENLNKFSIFEFIVDLTVMWLAQQLRGVVGRGDNDISEVLCLVLSLYFADIAHCDVDKGVLDQRQEHEDGARRHEDVDSLLK